MNVYRQLIRKIYTLRKVWIFIFSCEFNCRRSEEREKRQVETRMSQILESCKSRKTHSNGTASTLLRMNALRIKEHAWQTEDEQRAARQIDRDNQKHSGLNFARTKGRILPIR